MIGKAGARWHANLSKRRDLGETLGSESEAAGDTDPASPSFGRLLAELDSLLS
jgi:hypothetical protein